jgi:hypothetical protein
MSSRTVAARLALAGALVVALGACGSKDPEAQGGPPAVEPTATSSAASTPSTPGAAPSSSASPLPTSGPDEDWTYGALPRERLGFNFPADWTYGKQKADGDGGVMVTVRDDTGFTVHIGSEKPGSAAAEAGGACGACEFGRTVGSLRLDGETVYVIDQALADGKASLPALSACEGPRKCLVKSAATGNLIDVYITYDAPGAGEPSGEGPHAPQEFSSDLPGYRTALKILASLVFEEAPGG